MTAIRREVCSREDVLSRFRSAQQKAWSDPSRRETQVLACTGLKRSVPGRRNIAEAVKQVWREHPEKRQKFAETMRRIWRERPETYANALRLLDRTRLRRFTPNKPEREVMSVLAEMKTPHWKFNGCGKGARKIAGHYPDFLNQVELKVMDVDGEYWHQDKAKDRKRNAAYRKIGYHVLVLKEKTVWNRQKLLKTLSAFFSLAGLDRPELQPAGWHAEVHDG